MDRPTTPGRLPAAGGLGRNLGLDVARAAAITMVIASHTLVNLVGPQMVTVLQWGGKAGVELFFGLSGFLIGRILITMAERDFGPREVGQFLFRRWMRTLPLYYIVLWYAGWFFGDQNPHAYLMLQNFYPAEPRMIAVSWSLVMEEYFYLFYPLTMLLCAAVIGGGVRVVATVAVSLIVVCTAGRICNAAGVFHVPLNDMHEHPFMRMDCAAYGVLAACAMTRPRLQALLAGRRARWALAVSVAMAGAWCALFTWVTYASPEELLALSFAHWGAPYFAFQWAALGPVFAVTVTALWKVRMQLPGALAACIQRVSLYSYSLYLVHVLVIVLVEYHGLAAPGVSRQGLIIVGSLIVAAATYHMIERPVLWLRDRTIPGGAGLPTRRRAAAGG